MFSTIRELSTPGVVEHCVSAQFTKVGRPQLVISRCRELEVYDMDTDNNVLELRAQYKLAGRVESICCIRQKPSPNNIGLYEELDHPATKEERLDLLLLSYGRGRASLVGYDADLGPHVMRTFSLYNFETEALGSNLRAETNGQSATYGYGANATCVKDPLGRCAAMLVNGFQVAVMPFDHFSVKTSQLVDQEDLKTKLSKAVRHVAMEAPDVWEMPPGCFLIDLSRLNIPFASVMHMEFLQDQHGLPVLAILHHGNVRSGTGRLVATRWTTHLTAITVSKTDVTVVWKVERLPHDSHAVVPTPQGGAIVLAQNTIHRIVGGSMREVFEVNGFARATADLDCSRQGRSETELILDGVRWVWLDKFRLLLSMKLGQLAVLDCGPHKLELALEVQSNQATCLTLVGPHHIFLGSRLADSLLLQFKLFIDHTFSTSNISSAYVATKTEETSNDFDEEERLLYGEPKDVTVLLEEDEDEENIDSDDDDIGLGQQQGQGHGNNKNNKRAMDSELQKQQQRKKRRGELVWGKMKGFSITAVDSLPCIGPVGGMCLSENPPDLVEIHRAKLAAKELQAKGKHSAAASFLNAAKQNENTRRKPKEIAVSAGRGRDGGIRVLFPGIRLDTTNDLVSDIDLQTPCQSLWTINPSPNRPECLVFATNWGACKFSGLRVMGDHNVANVETLDNLKGLEESPTPTLSIHATGKYIVQVCLDRISLINAQAPYDIVKTLGVSVRGAFPRDEYILVIQRQNRLPHLYRIVGDDIVLESQFETCCEEQVATGYVWKDHPKVYCGLVRAGLSGQHAGALEIYDITNPKSTNLVFRSDHAIAVGVRAIKHRPLGEPVESNEGILAKVKVVSLCVAKVGRVEPDDHCAAHKVDPKLCVGIVLANGDLMLYRVDDGWTRLYRVESDVVTRIDRNILNRSTKQQVDESQQEQEEENNHDGTQNNEANQNDLPREQNKDLENDGKTLAKYQSSFNEEDKRPRLEKTTKTGRQVAVRASSPKLVAFDYLGGFCGMMLVSGLGTSCCVIGSRGFIRTVRIEFDAYHVWNISPNRGRLFMLSTSRSKSSRTVAMDVPPRMMIFSSLKLMRFMRLDAGGSMPLVRIPLRCSVVKMVNEPANRCFVALCSEDDPTEEEAALVVRAKCSVRLICADTYQVLDEYSLMRHEKAITIVNVTIDIAPQNTTPRNFVDFLAVGTGFVGPEGEDAGCKGRVLIFAVEQQDPPPPGTGKKRKKLVLRHKIESKHIRGPATSITCIDGMLLVTFGTSPCSLRIFYYDPGKDEFIARSFYDTCFCTVSMKVMKNYLLMGDVYKSVQLVHWHNFKREFRVLARDAQPCSVYECDFLQHERHLGMIVTDNNENLRLLHFNYAKNWLQDRGEIHIGSSVLQLLQLQTAQDKSINLYGTLDGQVGAVVPMTEQVYRRLFALQAAMSSSPLVPRNSGLNPRAYRMATYTVPLQRQRTRNIADGAILWAFPGLDHIVQRKLARQVGTTPETIYQDLLELDRVIFTKAL